MPPAVGRPASVPEAAWRAWLLAQAWADRDVDPGVPAPDPRAEALRELAYVREHAPAFEPALRLEEAPRWTARARAATGAAHALEKRGHRARRVELHHALGGARA